MEKIAILDCGGQYTKVIDRKIREALVKSDIFPVGVKASELSSYSGLILTGGPESVWDKNALCPDGGIFSLGLPILGICYGMHVIATHFGGAVAENIKKEYGEADIKIDNSCSLFYGLAPVETVLMSHGDTVSSVPPDFKVCAFSGEAAAGIYNEEKNIYGVQFHPEVDMTINGKTVFENFLRKICGITEKYSLEDRLVQAVDKVKTQALGSKVMVLVSGGVDSAVTAGILLRALHAEDIYAVHIDHGFMRKNESDIICEGLAAAGLKNIVRVNAKDVFYKNLEGVLEPEKKRNIIGDTFIKTLQAEMAALNLDMDKTFIAQGTLRPDLIESGNPDVSGHAKKIKTHHNDVEIVRRAREKGLVIETNYDWHKDEVRKIAAMLGLPKEIVNRQPFPGPGLAVRLLLQDGKKRVNPEENAALKALVNEIDSGYKACMLPVLSVGVQGDNRTYAGLAAVYTDGDAAVAWESMYALSRAVTNKLPFINRLVYVLGTHKGIETAQAHEMYINDECVELLRGIDHLVTTRLENKNISQTFAVLLPISSTEEKPIGQSTGTKYRYSAAVRTFVTSDFMTGRPAPLGSEIPFGEIFALADDIKSNFSEIEYVFYDITSKPPATCEWE